jgi:O-antigen ligase
MRATVVAIVSVCTWMFAAAAPALADDGSTSGAATTTLVVVILATVLAFAAAIIAGRKALRSPPTTGLRVNEDLLDIDLLGSHPSFDSEPRIVGIFEKVFLGMLLLYALFDRGFAWFHIPGTPLFVGEMALGLGIFAMLSSRFPLRTAIRWSPGLKALAIWMAWGFTFFVLQVPIFGIDAVRDSAQWYYGVTAIFTVFLLLSDPSRFGRWADLFAKALPFLLAWFPIAIALDSLFGQGAPFVPDSEIPLFTHRFGNIAVFSGIAIGFIWLVDRERGRFSGAQRITYTSLAAIAILLAGFQNRGGLVSATVGIFVMLLFLHRRRGELVLVLAGVAIVLATVAIVSNVRIPISNGREISATQMMANISSVIDPDSGGQRQTGTTQWRIDLWTKVLDDVTTERPLTGWGPGPHLGKRYGVTTKESVPLRNPHNSHLGVLARMGFIGLGMWAIIWIAWVFQLLQLRSQLRRRGRPIEAGLVAWLLVSTFMILVNAIFDPTLEGPQVAFWIWTFFGVGVALPLVYAGLTGRVRDWTSDAAPDGGPGNTERIAGGPALR